ncbi:hypothetical protein Bca4012_055730 [Brassica carinata]|uniref:MADS-box domain-containing protein n=1 Tax=Brassica carinata TaxID=52824 RepID=A0A8X7PYI4_BRACI|nr:hypothetical protein Bca52824_078882 [Brassica carinata]
MEEVKETLSTTFFKSNDQFQNPNVLVTQTKKELTTARTPKTSRGRQKIEIKEITEDSKRHVTFSKRRRGLFKKAAELSVLTGAKIAVVTFSKCGRIYSFGHVDSLMDKYLRKIPVKLEVYSGDESAEVEGRPWWERPVESVPEEELEEYIMAMSVLRDKLGKKISDMGSVVPAWQINMIGWKPQMDMQSMGDVADGVTRCRLGQNG